jgi:hypothetical protein
MTFDEFCEIPSWDAVSDVGECIGRKLDVFVNTPRPNSHNIAVGSFSADITDFDSGELIHKITGQTVLDYKRSLFDWYNNTMIDHKLNLLVK